MVQRIVIWLYILLLLIAGAILGQVCRSAIAGSDPFIARLEMLLGVHPGELLPVDMRAPDIRLEYEGAKATPDSCYEVKVCRAR